MEEGEGTVESPKDGLNEKVKLSLFYAVQIYIYEHIQCTFTHPSYIDLMHTYRAL